MPTVIDKEFSVGDEITFAPYETENPMFVIGVNSTNIFGEPEITYRLNKNPDALVATSVTSPKSIKESKYYEVFNASVSVFAN